MSVLDQILTLMLNSLKGNQLPLATSVGNSDLIIFWSIANGQFEAITKSDFYGNNPSIESSFLGNATTAGSTTTNQEIEDFINAQGFIINPSTIFILEVGITIADQVFKAKYFYKPNEAGTYGTAASNEIDFADLYELNVDDFNSSDVVIHDLGDIGVSSIEAHINTLVGTTYVLNIGTVYYFQCIKNSNAETYLYIGSLPNTIGDGGNIVGANDFYLFAEEKWIWIDRCWVQKAGSNTNTTIIEAGDIVFFKNADYNGTIITMIGWTYNGGGTTDANNYTKTLNIA